MSIEVVNHVLGTSKARGAERMVLVVIAESTGKDGTCRPGLPRIAERSALSENRARTAVEALERAGELLVEERPGTSHRYAIPGAWVPAGFDARPARPAPARKTTARFTPLNTGVGVNTGVPLNTGGGVNDPEKTVETATTPPPVLTQPLNTGGHEPYLNRKDNAFPVPVLSSTDKNKSIKTKDSLAPKKAREADVIFDAIAGGWNTTAGGFIGQLKSIMLGRSNKPGWKASNFEPPVTGADEINGFTAWYHDTYPDITLPSAPHLLQKHFYAFRGNVDYELYLTRACVALEDQQAEARAGPEPDMPLDDTPPDPEYAALIDQRLNQLAESKSANHDRLFPAHRPAAVPP